MSTTDLPGTDERLALSNLFDVCARGFNPPIFGDDDRRAGPLVTKAQCQQIAAALRSAPRDVREACAKVCDEVVERAERLMDDPKASRMTLAAAANGAMECAENIRALPVSGTASENAPQREVGPVAWRYRNPSSKHWIIELNKPSLASPYIEHGAEIEPLYAHPASQGGDARETFDVMSTIDSDFAESFDRDHATPPDPVRATTERTYPEGANVDRTDRPVRVRDDGERDEAGR